jgi:hypothetical protein
MQRNPTARNQSGLNGRRFREEKLAQRLRGKAKTPKGSSGSREKRAREREAERRKIADNVADYFQGSIGPSFGGSAKLLVEVYEQLAIQTPGFRVGSNLKKDLRELLERNGIKSILEVGPGKYGGLVGLIYGIALDAGAKAHALDVVPPNQYIPRSIDYQIADVKNLQSKFPGQKFDLIMGHGVFETGSNPYESPADNTLEKRIRKTKTAARAILSALSDNPNAFVVLSSHTEKTPLRRAWIEKSAEVLKWDRAGLDVSDYLQENIGKSLANSPYARARYFSKAIPQFASTLVVRKKPRQRKLSSQANA